MPGGSGGTSGIFYPEPPPYDEPLILTDKGQGSVNPIWFLWFYQLFGSMVALKDLEVLEAFDATRDNIAAELANQAAALALLSDAPGNTREIEALQKQAAIADGCCDDATRITQLEKQVALLLENISESQRISDLEKLVYTLDDSQSSRGQIAALLAMVGFTNIAGSGGGVPLNGSGIPSASDPLAGGTRTVTALPNPATSTIGDTVIYNNYPYVFRADPSGGATGYWAQSSASAVTISDTHAARAGYAAASYPQGTLYYETDRKVTYMVQFPGGVAAWLYYNGVYEDVLANLPAGLGVNDINYTFRASDYLHNWTWDGGAWHYSGNDASSVLGSGYTIDTAGGVLPYGAWGLLNGSTYAISKDDATTFNLVTGVVANRYIRL